MSNKRRSIGATGGMFENWSVHFDKTVHIHEVAGSLPEFTATHHALTNLGVNIHVDITTTIALFLIGEPITAWHWAKGFGEKLHIISKEWNFTSLGFAD